MSRTELFDYEKMALEAARERDAIKARLDMRKKNRPLSHERELIWKRENSILYTMYLEQRSNERKFSQRARERAEKAKEAEGKLSHAAPLKSLGAEKADISALRSPAA